MNFKKITDASFKFMKVFLYQLDKGTLYRECNYKR